MLPIHKKIKTCLNIPIWPAFWWTKNIYIVQKIHQGHATPNSTSRIFIKLKNGRIVAHFPECKNMFAQGDFFPIELN